MAFFRRFLPKFILMALFMMPFSAFADALDKFSLAPFVPYVLESMMSIASASYEFFVTNGILYVLIFGFLAITIVLYYIKLFIPGKWSTLIGLSDNKSGGQFDSWTIVYNVLKPCFRALIAMSVLLQLRPVLITDVLVSPFLQLGSVYTESITKSIRQQSATPVECPASIVEKEWISESACKFLIQPVDEIHLSMNVCAIFVSEHTIKWLIKIILDNWAMEGSV